jgi:hypothetical protein
MEQTGVVSAAVLPIPALVQEQKRFFPVYQQLHFFKIFPNAMARFSYAI